MAPREGFDRLNCGVSSALDLRRRLRRRVGDAEWMQRQREGREVMPIRALHLFPALHLRSFRLDLCLGRCALGQPRAAFQDCLGLREVLVGLA